eukprot:scaffold15271_cov110-Isochrysis_galbana.AAC.1
MCARGYKKTLFDYLPPRVLRLFLIYVRVILKTSLRAEYVDDPHWDDSIIVSYWTGATGDVRGMSSWSKFCKTWLAPPEKNSASAWRAAMAPRQLLLELEEVDMGRGERPETCPR